MTKIYKINGKEIKGYAINPDFCDTATLKMMSKFNELLEALDEKKQGFRAVAIDSLAYNSGPGGRRDAIYGEQVKEKEEKIRELEGKRVSYPRDEKREKMAQDANYKNMPEYGEFWRNVKRSSIEEPKSTLREATSEIIFRNLDWKFLSQKECEFTNTDEVADKIISLFKDTLLKEIEDKETRLNPFSEREEIINLIKNL